MYTLRSTLRRGTNLTAAIALAMSAVIPAVIPAGHAFADTLNPLTKRSLTLSSSAPGWSHTDGSGNSTYAPPNSGANGQKTGNTFAFNVSSDSTSNKIQTMSFQYCTTSAGTCTSPGDDATHGTDTASTADLNVHFGSAAEVGPTDFNTVINSADGSVKAVPGYDSGVAGDPASAAAAVAGNFVVYYNDAGTWTQSSGWTATAMNEEDGSSPTGQNNYIVLANTTGLGIPSDTPVKVIFFGTNDNYITNPGSGAFFVKINTYNKAYDGTTVTDADLEPQSDANVIDGGVTVANVMNQSIQITTKVLETMQFSVGTVDPNTLASDGTTTSALYNATYNTDTSSGGLTKHGPCDPILTAKVYGDPQNVLQIGDQGAESSLSDTHTYSTHSYWRLSSNSSAGATVYYSGHTLSNTEGDQIAPIGATAAQPHAGTEQFGLAIDADTTDPYATSYAQEATYENGADNGLTAVDASTTTDNAGNGSYHAPQLAPLAPTAQYGAGEGAIDGSTDTSFAFDGHSDTIPVSIATENSQVVDCVTAKMRYIANIAATTPAGIYTTKVNYIAAPQY